MQRPNELDKVPEGYELTKTEREILDRRPWLSLRVTAGDENGAPVGHIKDAATVSVLIMEGRRIVYETRRKGPMSRGD